MGYLGQNKNYVAACYARLSVDDMQDGTSVSIDTQKKILEDYCKNNNIIIYDFYCDDGYTGTNFDRPSFKRMLKDAENKQFNMVIVKDLSRFGREYIGVGEYIESYFPQRQIRFVAIGDNFDSELKNGDLDFIVPMKNLFNQFYPADCSRKVRQALKAKAARGEFTGAKAPYGYKKSPEDKHKLIVDDETAPVVVRIFELIAYHGYGYTKVAKTFSEEKILTPYATHMRNENKPCEKNPYDWNLGSVSAILHNETYIGNLVSGLRETISFKNKKVVKKDRDDCVIVEGIFPSLVSKQLWDDAHKRVKERKRKNSSSGMNIFAGLIRCDKCGKVLGLSGRTDGRTYYCCETYKKKGKQVCTSHYTLYEDLYNTVLTNVRNTVKQITKQQFDFNSMVMNSISDEIESHETYQQKICRVEEQIRKLNNKFDQMYQDKLEGIISLDKFKELVKADEEKIKVLQQNLKELRKMEMVEKDREKYVQSFVDKIEEIGEVRELNPLILNTLIDKIVVGERLLVDGLYEQEITIFYKFENEICFSN